MTEELLDYAEEKFREGKVKEAFDLATSAKTLDPFFGSVKRYYVAFGVHYWATKRNKFGQVDLYAVLGLKGDPSALSTDDITNAFCGLVKLVHPDRFPSTAAPGALRLITQAWEVLSDETTRAAYDVRMGIRPPPPTTHHRSEAAPWDDARQMPGIRG
jgi:hypothetical protein